MASSSHDYFTFKPGKTKRGEDVGTASSTAWEAFGTFFVVYGVIRSERSGPPAQIAAAFALLRGKLERVTDQLHDRAHSLNEVWRRGPASVRFHWYVGATVFAIDKWVDSIETKVDWLGRIAEDIEDARQAAHDLLVAFKNEYFASIPAGAAAYGFPPDLGKMKADGKDDLAAKVAAIYERLHKKYFKLIVKVGAKLSRRFVTAGVGMQNGHEVPVTHPGPDIAKPWVNYSARSLTARPIGPAPVAPAPIELAPLSVRPAEVLTPMRVDRTGSPALRGLPASGQEATPQIVSRSNQPLVLQGLQALRATQPVSPLPRGALALPLLVPRGLGTARTSAVVPRLRGDAARGVLTGRFQVEAGPQASTGDIPVLSGKGQAPTDLPGVEVAEPLGGRGPAVGGVSSMETAAATGLHHALSVRSETQRVVAAHADRIEHVTLGKRHADATARPAVAPSTVDLQRAGTAHDKASVAMAGHAEPAGGGTAPQRAQ
ncbi:hypothetical protein Drose_25800 [Dactylosporangium roseum]|uniref:PPE family domain-containing protein n=1 Tax=Dactylosporangium roseum TaxID=47989 RepID=A0ABY5Z1J8_9ACTN|nr:hypothetical protein [Dactylosporangium roseum]UWZ34623.1 hypothetical protein Drose_25800 [Dactylosporangium roseum]